MACLSGCLFVCLYPINVKTTEPIGLKFLWDLTEPQGRFMQIKISNICLHQNSIFIKFLKIFKIHEFFCLISFYNVYKANMFTIEIEDGREAY